MPKDFESPQPQGSELLNSVQMVYETYSVL